MKREYAGDRGDKMTFRIKRNVKLSYDEQGYIFFVSRRYKKLPQKEKDKILNLCIMCGGQYYPALFEFVTTNASGVAVCLKHYISKGTLYRMVRRYYEAFLEWI